MLNISDGQMLTLGQSALEGYLKRLIRHLQQAEFASARARFLTSADDANALREVVGTLIARADRLGIRQEGDVTPFILFSFLVDDEFRHSSIAPWISAMIGATEWPAEQRLDAVYALLPPALREACFTGI